MEDNSCVDAVVVAVPKKCRREINKNLLLWKFGKVVAVVNGGKERVDSTRNALKAVPAGCAFVGIHDGARALVEPHLVRECFRAAEISGAAILAVPSQDTVKVADRNLFIKKTVPRDMCWSAQTPQVFRRDVAENIHKKSPADGKSFTDDASLAERRGFRVKIVPGSYENIKITTPVDLRIAETILQKRRAKKLA